MRDVPAGVHQPRHADESIGAKTEVDDRRHDRRKGQLPRTEPAAQIHTARAGHEDRVKRVTAWLPHERHDDDEHDGSDDWADVVRDEKRGRAVQEDSGFWCGSYGLWQTEP